MITVRHNHICSLIQFDDGIETLLQGDEAYSLRDRLDRCTTTRQEQSVLSDYHCASQTDDPAYNHNNPIEYY